MGSVVLTLPPPPRSPHHFSLSRSTTPTAPSPPKMPSRPTTPRPRTPTASALPPNLTHHLSQPISAPPTPVTPTHYIGMERCRSSEPVLGNPFTPDRDRKVDGSRGGRTRDVKATSLLFKTVPSAEQISSTEKAEWSHIESPSLPQDDKMDVDGEVAGSDESVIWGMPKWGFENERGGEVRKGVRLVGMEELPGLIEQHSNIDTPSHVLFPWLHGICDDGQKGCDMASFFGHEPPFQPPPYRGLSVMLVSPQIVNKLQQKRTNPLSRRRPQPLTSATSESNPVTVDYAPVIDLPGPRDRSETLSTSSDSYLSSGNTDITTPSLADPAQTPEVSKDDCQVDVQMHPCESKRLSPAAPELGRQDQHGSTTTESGTKTWVPLYGGPPVYAEGQNPADVDGESESNPELTNSPSASASDSSESLDEEQGPSCILLNALHVQDVFDLPGTGRRHTGQPRFRPAKLPAQINLRNLNIQQIKYSTISDIILYAKDGVSDGLLKVAEMVAQAQEELYQFRLNDYYRALGACGSVEGVETPVRYGVWCVVEPFHKLEKFCPSLVNLDSVGNPTGNSPLTDLFDREAKESRAMTRATEVVEGFWVGNDWDVPGGADDGAGAEMSFDVCVRCSECSDIPSTSVMSQCYRRLADLDKRRGKADDNPHSWTASPATVALRNLLSPSTSPTGLPDVPAKRGASSPLEEDGRQRRSRQDAEYVSIECAGTGRPYRPLPAGSPSMLDRFVEFIYLLRKLVEGRDKSGVKRRVLVHCQDGYTESSILVLGYIMSSLSISLPEAYLHLQNTAGRSFFLYPTDKGLMNRLDQRLAADRKAKALKLVSGASPTSPIMSSSPATASLANLGRWKNWTLGLNRSESASSNASANKAHTVEAAKELLNNEENGGSDAARKAKIWFADKRFDGFPSRILPFLYLGNLEHAGNAGMLEALGITHVVSVGETLISCPLDCDPMYGKIGPNALANAYHQGKVKVMDILAIRDDGNDPLRPTIANACEWIEQARLDGGKVLVHCRVGVSRSASIVIAYMMQHLQMSLMDAYLITRARRLNVLIQPNLRFFHELFGWEVELARREEEERQRLVQQAREQGVEAQLDLDLGPKKREILYSWPSFCRDLYCLNRRFLCN